MNVIEFNGCSYLLKLDASEASWSLLLKKDEQLILKGNSLLMMTPLITDCYLGEGRIYDIGIQPGGSRLVRIVATISGALHGEVVNEIYMYADRFVCESHYILDSEHSLEHWSMSGSGGFLGGDAVHAYTGIHGGRDVNGTIMDIKGELEISTKTHNWMYANASPRLLIRNGSYCIVFGGTRVANDFGLELKSNDNVIEFLRFNYGGSCFPWKLKGRTRIQGPRLQMQVSKTTSHDEANRLFTKEMINDGIISRKQHAPEEYAWRKPWYCTWGDQMAISVSSLRQEQTGQPAYADIKAVLTQDFVLKAAKFIRERRLNVGTIIIDDGWQDKRGDWNLDTEKFPDMRGLVDELHLMDFKVAIWLAPFLTESDSEILKRVGFTCCVSKHNQTVVDYSNPEVRKWICEKFDLWFSSAPGCWDIDGLKLDFLVEKVYPDAGCSDSEWRGEERLYCSLFKMFDQRIRQHKPVPGLLHAPYNAHWMSCCAALYGEERFDKDFEYLKLRQTLIEAVAPGAWISPHFNYNVEVVPEFLRRVKEMGGIAQIGKLLCQEMTQERVEELRGILADRLAEDCGAST